jgi:hypothetical protein
MFIQKSLSILLLSLVSAHCGQLVAPDKIEATNGDKIKHGKYGFKSIGQSSTDFDLPIADFHAPKDYIGLNEEESYKKMLADGLSVKDLFKQVVSNADVAAHYDALRYGGFTAETCGYFDPEFEVKIAEDTHPQTSTTGNNHGGPAEIWIDDVMTHHTSNLMANQPEVLSRAKYNCNKDSCLYKWYWIAFRADQKKPTFQMWVNCARIKGNGKAPIPVEPTGLWRDDPRGEHKHLYAKPNDNSLDVCDNPSERIVFGYSSETVVTDHHTETAQTEGASEVSTTEAHPAVTNPTYVAPVDPPTTPYVAVVPPTYPCRGRRRKRSINAGRR